MRSERASEIALPRRRLLLPPLWQEVSTSPGGEGEDHVENEHPKRTPKETGCGGHPLGIEDGDPKRYPGSRARQG
eukprot:3792340-Prymnesium_polylepis.1